MASDDVRAQTVDVTDQVEGGYQLERVVEHRLKTSALPFFSALIVFLVYLFFSERLLLLHCNLFLLNVQSLIDVHVDSRRHGA